MSAVKRPEARKGAKIRFVMLEADVDDGNFRDLASAITSALRSPTVSPRAIAAPAPPAVLTPGEPSAETTDDELVEEEEVVEEQREAKPRSQKAYRPKVDAIEIDLDSGPEPFEAFARANDPVDAQKRYLLIAAWFKRNRKLDSVNLDHFYTCYLKMGWTALEDMSYPCRKLASKSWVTYADRTLTLNHIGLDKAGKLTKGVAAA